jgi:hypothetical protein
MAVRIVLNVLRSYVARQGTLRSVRRNIERRPHPTDRRGTVLVLTKVAMQISGSTRAGVTIVRRKPDATFGAFVGLPYLATRSSYIVRMARTGANAPGTMFPTS